MIHHVIFNINNIYIVLTICIRIHAIHTGNVGKQDVTLLLQQINRIAITFLKSIDNTTTHNINTHTTHTVHNTTTASTPTNNSTSDNNEHDNKQPTYNNDSNMYINKHSNSIIICEEPETEIIISSARSENEHFYLPIPIDIQHSTTTNNATNNNDTTDTSNTNNIVQEYDYNKVYELIKQNDTFKILKNTI